MAKATAKGQSRNTKNKVKEKDKPKERRLPVPKLPQQWKVGDEIVAATSKDGYVVSTTTIRKLETGYGCKNLHVNDTACYDRSIPQYIAVEETEALAILAGIKFDDDEAEMRTRIDALFGE